MEHYRIESEKAKKKLKVADHMLSVTFPLVRDPKLLMAIMENLNSALSSAMTALISYDRLFKKVPPFAETFESKFNTFALNSMQRHSLDPDYVRLIHDVNEIVAKHKDSPVEFTRHDKFVICSDSYNITSIAKSDIEKYIRSARKFIDDVDSVIEDHERILD